MITYPSVNTTTSSHPAPHYMAQELIYPTVVLWFTQDGVATTLTLQHSTLTNAWSRAEAWGWARPKWWAPWRYCRPYGVFTLGTPHTSDHAPYSEVVQ